MSSFRSSKCMRIMIAVMFLLACMTTLANAAEDSQAHLQEFDASSRLEEQVRLRVRDLRRQRSKGTKGPKRSKGPKGSKSAKGSKKSKGSKGPKGTKAPKGSKKAKGSKMTPSPTPLATLEPTPAETLPTIAPVVTVVPPLPTLAPAAAPTVPTFSPAVRRT
ncbi:hypothetical protein MPSEU_000009600 [Mayamaea pseudoterrestris]|nr:hypothetical protein MPSEU_000009600 [Mayamaea pseudoterrestris]